MNRYGSVCIGIIAGILLGLAPAYSFAQLLDHHGNGVNAAATARECISCHDGTLGKHVSFCTVKCGFQTPHSIHRKYPPRGKEGEYAPPAAVEAKGIRIVDGRVTCITCHSLKNPGRNHLAVERDLCRNCHIKK